MSKYGRWRDDQAEELIGRANDLLDLEAFAAVEAEEKEITQRLRDKLGEDSEEN